MSLLFHLFILCGAHAAVDTSTYVHLRAVAESVRDVTPRQNGGAAPPAFPLNKTRFHATVDLFLNPQNLKDPAFLEARYNVRRQDHALIEVQTGVRPVHFLGASTYEATVSQASGLGEVLARRRGSAKADYSEPPFDFTLVVAETLETNMMHMTNLPPSSVRVSFVSVAFSLDELLSGATPERIAFRILHDDMNLAESRQTTLSRRRFTGPAEVRPLTTEDRARISQLADLAADPSCGARVGRSN